MSSKWGKSSSHQSAGDSGILRKADGIDKIEELLVFGYACKLFRDDEKALEIDQGKHLIPWMGDDSLKIDRYDGRAALTDLTLYEASSEGYDTARWLGLTDAERRVEQLCDEERYRALHTNEDEEELYREEELKRLHQQLSNSKNYGQVGFNYDGPKEGPQEENPENQPEVEEDDEPFVPPPNFDLPYNMIIPKTVKQNARIEKTALFISQQGAQMEILLKAKQAGNSQFDFLSHDSQLHSYYRHILMAYKTGRLNCPAPPQPKSNVPENEDSEHYLHPSLAPVTSRVEAAPSIPNITYKPSADCAYTMLISKIKGQTAPKVETPPPPTMEDQQTPRDEVQEKQTTYVGQPPVETTTSNTYNFPPNSTYIYNYQTGKYEPAPPPPVIQYQPEFTPIQGPAIIYTQPNEITKSAIIYSKTPTQPVPPSIEEVPKKEKPTPLLPIAHYSSSENEETEDEENATKAIINVLNYEVPPSDIQLIVDKMASYVARNGADFESIVRSKGDPRFSFLNDSHVYNGYYRHKLKVYGGVSTTPTEVKEEKEDVKKEKSKEKNKNSDKVKKIIAPVSFSIKKSKDPESVPIERSALPVEESSDEDATSRETVTPPIDGNESQEVSSIPVPAEIGASPTTVQAIKLPAEPSQGSGANTPGTTPPPPDLTDGKNVAIIDIEDPVQELIDLTDDLEERRDQKRAEDKIKDKIAAAAREKMFLSRNRELQIERKRRAAAFLNKIKPNELIINGSDVVSSERTAEEDDLLKRISEFDTREDDDEKRRHHKSKKKRRKRSTSSEKRHKRSKHRHRSVSRKRRHRSRSRSSRHRSKSRVTSSSYRSHHRRSSRSRTIDINDKPSRKHRSSRKKKEDKSSGEITSADSSYDSD